MLNKTCGESAMSYFELNCSSSVQPQTKVKVTKYSSLTGSLNKAWIYIPSGASSNYLSGAASGSTREETRSFSPCRACRRHLQHQRFPDKRILQNRPIGTPRHFNRRPGFTAQHKICVKCLNARHLELLVPQKYAADK